MPSDLIRYQSVAGPQLLAEDEDEGIQCIRRVPQVRIDVGKLVLAVGEDEEGSV